MSQSSSSKGKDASGKKFASLNVNQTFKGTKVENRSAAGQSRHGMQLLGKVSQSRRIPAPAYLPSLKKENLGNDPTVSLVPSGSSGWGKKEKNVSKTEDQMPSGPQKPQKADQAPEISLRPNAGAGFKSQSDQGKGWGNLQSGAGATQPSSSNLFQREFPKLGVDGEGPSTDESAKGKDSDEKEPASSSTSNAPPRFGGDKWMPGQVPMQGPGQRPGGPPMNMSIEQQRALFNGAHMPPPGASQFYPYGPMPYMMMPPHFPYPYPPTRMPPPGVMGQPPRPAPAVVPSEASERPATVKTEDIQDMGDDSDDEGWAGAQEEVDYNVKLKFDESDEEPEPIQTTSSEKKSKDESSLSSKESNDEKSKENAPAEAWGEHPPGYQGPMQFRHPQQWIRGPFPQGFPYPPPWMYPSMQGYGIGPVSQQRPDGAPAPQQLTTAQQPTTTQVVTHTGASVAEARDSDPVKNAERRKRKEEDEKNEAARREAARIKLKEIEDKIRKRGEELRDTESSMSSHRERLDSENSDSSRSGSQRSKSSRDMPPRFLKQQSQPKGTRKDDAAPPSPSPFDSAESSMGKDTIPVPRIMKRHDSLRSDDASSIHSHDSWANVSVDEQEKNKDTEEVFAPLVKRGEKSFEGEVASKQDESYERHDKRSEKHGNEADARRKQNEAKLAAVKAEGAEESQKSSRPPSASGYDLKSQKGDQSRDSRRSSRSSDSRRDGGRDNRPFRDYRDQGKSDRGGEMQDQVKEERQTKDRYRESRKEIGTELSKKGKETLYVGSDERTRDVKSVKESKREATTKDSANKETAEKTFKEKADTHYIAEKDERKPSDRTGGSVKPRTISDNFKRLEKTRGKALLLKGSKTDEKEKQLTKTVQKNISETKKPSVWSHVVSGETADHSTGFSVGKVEEQPKKSLIEIQKEEEIENEKENLKQSAKEDKDKQIPGDDRDEQDFQKHSRMPKDRRQDDRRYEDRRYDGRVSSRRGYERHDDRYYDKREHQGRRKTDRESRRTDERIERKYADSDDKDANIESKYDASTTSKGYDGRKRGMEDRKRRHEETEIAIDPYEQIYSAEVEAEGRMREQKIEKQKSFEKRHDRMRHTERSRGAGRGRPTYSRGRGRPMTGRTAVESKEGYPFSEIKTDIAGSFSDKAQSLEVKDDIKSEVKGPEDDHHDEKYDKEASLEPKDTRKEKENREPEKRGFGVPPKKSDTFQHESRRQRDREGSYYHERSNSRHDRSDSRWGRGSSGYSKYGPRKEPGSDRRRDRKVENGSSSNKPDEAEGIKSAENAKDRDVGDKARVKGNESDYDDDEYEDEEDYTDDYEDESDAENGEKGTTKVRSSDGRNKDDRERRTSERGSSRMQSGRGNKSRQREHRSYDSSISKSTVPPRFLKHKGSKIDRPRGGGYGIRGSRGRERIRGSRGRGFGRSPYARDSKQKSSDGRGDENSGESDDEYHSAEGSLGSANEESKRTETRHSTDLPKRHSTRGKPPSRGASTRGRGSRRGGSTDHFLADRQQDGVGHIDASGLAGTLPAAGKALFADQKAAEEKYGPRSTPVKRGSSIKRQTGDQRAQLYNDSHQEFSEPPKKMAKSKSIEKPDILRQFDVNNIASVVCIDDMPQNSENAENLSQAEEDDGFVEVCSRKKQKVLREIQKEEEKKKLQEELNVKSSKRIIGDAKEAASKSRHFKAVEQHTQRVTQSFSPVTSQTQITSVSQSQTSNAAMAAVGGWEPAQALLRGVQMVSQVEILDGSKAVPGPTQPPMNAWKRPLSFAAQAPDPKAVGTGKPNTSPAKQLPIAAQINQPSDGVMVNGPQMPYNDTMSGNEQVKAKDMGKDGANIEGIAIDKHERSSDGENKDRKSSTGKKPEQRKINKGTKRETAPRFQGMAKAKVQQSPILMNGEVIGEKKKVSATMEDVPKSVLSKLKVEDRAPGKRPDSSKLRRCNSESSKEQPENGLRNFDGMEHPTLTFMHPDTRSDSEKAQSKLKEEIHRRKDIISTLDGTLGKVDAPGHTTEEENAKDTARSVIKSLGDDDEKNLETRSLPSSTPPLAVDIHPPGPSTGPSSDPGTKGPVITVANSMSQEVKEMSKKVESLKVLWDTPSLSEVITEAKTSHTTWSAKDSTVVTSSVVTTTAESEQRKNAKAKDQVAPTPVAVVTAQGMSNKNEVDLNAEAPNDPGVISKKTTAEQQNNVCKVKPQQKQQQQLTEEKQILPPFSHSQLFPSQFPLQQTYTLSMQSSSSHNKPPYVMPLERAEGGVYSRERSTGDITSHHAQPHAPVSLQQVRPTSPLSHHQQQDILQQNVLLGNIYSTPALQGTQQNTLLWPVVSRHGMQPTTSLSYMSHPQSHHDPAQDLLSSSATLSSTPLYMTYDQTSSSIFSAQRMNSQMPQNPPVGLVLQQPQLRTASLFNVMQASQNTKDNSIFSMSPSPNPFQQASDLQLMSMSQSDLTKHVNAKPFQPSSRTPPSAQPQQLINQHHSQFLGHQHPKFPSHINKMESQSLALHHQQGPDQHSSSLNLPDKRQFIQHHANQQHSIQHLLPSHQQPVQPQSASQHSSMSHQIRPLALQQSSLQQTSPFLHAFPGGRIASVGPRSAPAKTVTTTASMQPQNRLGSMSPVDQSMHFIQAGISSVKGLTQPHQLMSNSAGNSLVQVRPYTQSLSVGQPPSHPFTVRPSSQLQKYSRSVPGPIQRPVKPTSHQNVVSSISSRPKQPVTPMVKTSEASNAVKNTVTPSIGSSFRNEEHQKMIEETKKYFAAQKNDSPSTTASSAAVPSTRGEPVSSAGLSNLQVSIAKSTESRTVKPVEIKPVESRQEKPKESHPNAELKSTKSSDVKESKPLDSKLDDDKSNGEKKDLPDIAASAMLNDPSDLISIIKSRPSLAKAFKIDGVNKEKGTEKPREKKPTSKEEKPKRSDGVAKRGPSSRGGHRLTSTKGEQKTGVTKSHSARKSDGSSEKGKSSNSRVKS